MIINTIDFNANYNKLHGQKKAELLSVRTININDLVSKDFIDYDTSVKNTAGPYPLKKGTYLLLVFLGDKNIPFTTCRTYSPKKEMFYKENINTEFTINITPF